METTLFPKLREKRPKLASMPDEKIINFFSEKTGENKDQVAYTLWQKFGSGDEAEGQRLLGNIESTKRSQEESTTKKVLGSTAVPFMQGASEMAKWGADIVDMAIPDDVAGEIVTINPMVNWGLTTVNKFAQNASEYMKHVAETVGGMESEAVKRSLTGDTPLESTKWDVTQKVVGEIARATPFMATTGVGVGTIGGMAAKAGMSKFRSTALATLFSSSTNAAVNASNDYWTTYEKYKRDNDENGAGLSDEEIHRLAVDASRKSLAMNFVQGLALDYFQNKNLLKLAKLIPTRTTTKQLGKELSEGFVKRFVKNGGKLIANSGQEGAQEMLEQWISNDVSGQPHDWRDYKEAGAVGFLSAVPFTAVGIVSDNRQKAQEADIAQTKRTVAAQSFDALAKAGTELKAKVEVQKNAIVEAQAIVENTSPEFIVNKARLEQRIKSIQQQSQVHANAMNDAEPNSKQFLDAQKRWTDLQTELSNSTADLQDLLTNKPKVEQPKVEETPAQSPEVARLSELQNTIAQAKSPDDVRPEIAEFNKLQQQAQTAETTPQAPQTLETAQGVTLPVSENTGVQQIPEVQTTVTEVQKPTESEQPKVEETSTTTPKSKPTQPEVPSVLTPTAEDYVMRSIEQEETVSLPYGQDVNALYNDTFEGWEENRFVNDDKNGVDEWLAQKGITLDYFVGKNMSDPLYAEFHRGLSALQGKYQDQAKQVIEAQNQSAQTVSDVVVSAVVKPEEELPQRDALGDTFQDAKEPEEQLLPAVLITPKSGGTFVNKDKHEVIKSSDGKLSIAIDPSLHSEKFDQQLEDFKMWVLEQLPVRNESNGTISKTSLKRAEEFAKTYLGADIDFEALVAKAKDTAEKTDAEIKIKSKDKITEEDKMSAEIGVKRTQADITTLTDMGVQGDDEVILASTKDARELGVYAERTSLPDLEDPNGKIQEDIYDAILNAKNQNAQQQRIAITEAGLGKSMFPRDNFMMVTKEARETILAKREQDLRNEMAVRLEKGEDAIVLNTEFEERMKSIDSDFRPFIKGTFLMEDDNIKSLYEQYKQEIELEGEVNQVVNEMTEPVENEEEIQQAYDEIDKLQNQIFNAVENLATDFSDPDSKDMVRNQRFKTVKEFVQANEAFLRAKVAEFNEMVAKYPQVMDELPPFNWNEREAQIVESVVGKNALGNKTPQEASLIAGNKIQNKTGGQVLNSFLIPGFDEHTWATIARTNRSVVNRLKKFPTGKYQYQAMFGDAKRSAESVAFNIMLPHTLARFDKDGHFRRVFWKAGDIVNLTDQNVNSIFSQDFKDNFLALDNESKERIWQMIYDGNMWDKSRITKTVYIDQNGREHDKFKPGYTKTTQVIQEAENGKVWTDDELRANYKATDKEIAGYKAFRSSVENIVDMMTENAELSGTFINEARKFAKESVHEIPEDRLGQIAEHLKNQFRDDLKKSGYVRMTRGSGGFYVKYPDAGSDTGYGYMRFESNLQAVNFVQKLQNEGLFSADRSPESFVGKDFKADYQHLIKTMSVEDIYALLDDAGIDIQGSHSDTQRKMVKALVDEINSRNFHGQSKIQRKKVPTRIGFEDYEKIYKEWAYKTSRKNAMLTFQPDIDEEIRLIDNNSQWKVYAQKYIQGLFNTYDNPNTFEKGLQTAQMFAYYSQVATDIANAVSDIATGEILSRVYYSEKQWGLDAIDIERALKGARGVASRYVWGENTREKNTDAVEGYKLTQKYPELPYVFKQAMLNGKISRALHEKIGDEGAFKKFLEDKLGVVAGAGNQFGKVRSLVSAYTLAKDKIIRNAIGNEKLASELVEIAGLTVEQQKEVQRENVDLGTSTLEREIDGRNIKQTEVSFVKQKYLNDLKSKIITGKIFEEGNEADLINVAMRFAFRSVDETNMIYGKRNTPQLATGAGSLKPLLRSGYQFRTFTRGMNGFFMSQLLNDRMTKKQFVYYLMMMGAVGGIKGVLPYWDDMDELLYQAGITNLDEDINEMIDNPTAYRLAMHGMASSIGNDIAFDLSQKMGRGAMFPRGAMKFAGELWKGTPMSDRTFEPTNVAKAAGELAVSSMGGAAFSKSLDVFKAFEDVYEGDDYTAWATVLNRQVGSILKAYESAQSGIKSSSGELMVDKDKVTRPMVALRAAGFRTQAEREELLKRKALRYAQGERDDIRKVLNNRIIDGLDEYNRSGDDSKLKRAVADMDINNAKALNNGDYHLLYYPDATTIKEALAMRQAENYKMKSQPKMMMPKSLKLERLYNSQSQQ